MTLEEFEKAMDNYELECEYSDYIMERTSFIGWEVLSDDDGEALLRAMERGLYYNGFMDTMVDSVEV